MLKGIEFKITPVEWMLLPLLPSLPDSPTDTIPFNVTRDVTGGHPVSCRAFPNNGQTGIHPRSMQRCEFCARTGQQVLLKSLLVKTTGTQYNLLLLSTYYFKYI